MSDPLRIAVVAEGPTDRIIIEAAMRAILGPRTFVLTQLQPEGSLAFGEATGWVGVYRWCRQGSLHGGGRLGGFQLLLDRFDLLIIHLDADVAGSTYEEGAIQSRGQDGQLPCEQPCPPASVTTDALRAVLLSWCDESKAPPGIAICIPSKGMEAWVIATLFPDDPSMKTEIECLPNPYLRLGQQKKGVRIKKRKADYERKSREIEAAWPRIATANGLVEAQRFQADVRIALAIL